MPLPPFRYLGRPQHRPYRLGPEHSICRFQPDLPHCQIIRRIVPFNGPEDSYSVKERTGSDSAYRNNSVIGCDVAFDILEYPQQASTDPDPVVALNRLIADEAPEALVLHHHKTSAILLASAVTIFILIPLSGQSRWMDRLPLIQHTVLVCLSRTCPPFLTYTIGLSAEVSSKPS